MYLKQNTYGRNNINPIADENNFGGRIFLQMTCDPHVRFSKPRRGHNENEVEMFLVDFSDKIVS